MPQNEPYTINLNILLQAIRHWTHTMESEKRFSTHMVVDDAKSAGFEVHVRLSVWVTSPAGKHEVSFMYPPEEPPNFNFEGGFEHGH